MTVFMCPERTLTEVPLLMFIKFFGYLSRTEIHYDSLILNEVPGCFTVLMSQALINSMMITAQRQQSDGTALQQSRTQCKTMLITSFMIVFVLIQTASGLF